MPERRCCPGTENRHRLSPSLLQGQRTLIVNLSVSFFAADFLSSPSHRTCRCGRFHRAVCPKGKCGFPLESATSVAGSARGQERVCATRILQLPFDSTAAGWRSWRTVLHSHSHRQLTTIVLCQRWRDARGNNPPGKWLRSFCGPRPPELVGGVKAPHNFGNNTKVSLNLQGVKVERLPCMHAARAFSLSLLDSRLVGGDVAPSLHQVLNATLLETPEKI